MHINNLTLAYILEEIKPVAVEGFVNKIQELGQGIFKIKIHSKQGTKDLIITDSSLFFTQYSFEVRQNPNQFFQTLKKFLLNKKILSLNQHDFDRVVVLGFQDYFLVFEFFHKSNVILTDKNYLIVAVLKKDLARGLARKQTYSFPLIKGKNPLDLTAGFLEKCFLESGETVFSELLAQANIAPFVAQEVLFRQKIDKKTPAKKISAEQAKNILMLVKEFYTVKQQSLKLFELKGELLSFQPSFEGAKQKESISLSAALDEFYSKNASKFFFGQQENDDGQKNETGLKKLRHSLAQQQAAKEKLQLQSLEDKKKGDLIYAHFNGINEVASAVKRAHEKQIDKKEIMYKINSALVSRKNSKIKISEIDFKRKEIELEVGEN